MIVYFKNKLNKKTIIGTSDTAKDCINIIKQFLKDVHYTYPYMRYVGNEYDGLTIDVGSYSEFFEITGVKFRDFVNEIIDNIRIEKANNEVW